MIILRKKKWLLITVLVFLSLATGCGSSEDSFRQESAMIVATPAGNTVPADTDTVTVVDQILPNSGEPARETPLQERIVIKNATLDIEVEDAREIGAAISGLAEALGGWVVSSNISSYEGQIYSDYTQGTVTIRVPADEFDMALEQIRGLGLDVRAESITGEDVTDEYVDLNSQLENLRASEDQLRQIMDRASTVNDVLTVRTELERVLGDINVIEGRLRFFQESAAYSSITVRLIRLGGDEPESEGEGWSAGDTVDEAIDALVSIAQVSADVIIWAVIVLLPIGLIVIVLGYIGLLVGSRALRFLQGRLPKP